MKARFWFLVDGKRVDVVTPITGTADYTAQAVMFLLRFKFGIRSREARLITGRYLPEAA